MRNISDLKKYALNYISKYSTSKKNLAMILQRKILKTQIEYKEKKILKNFIKNILEEFETKNFISDENYATSKINFLLTQGKSKNYIFNYLIKKGIDKNLINKIFLDLNMQNSDWELNSARIFIRKKRLNFSQNSNNEKDLAKMIRAGFNYELIKKLI
tara:strand:+ start:244 stop:717 length:474 start_codon:yes stop_codon:yes gene_type:complete